MTAPTDRRNYSPGARFALWKRGSRFPLSQVGMASHMSALVNANRIGRRTRGPVGLVEEISLRFGLCGDACRFDRQAMLQRRTRRSNRVGDANSHSNGAALYGARSLLLAFTRAPYRQEMPDRFAERLSATGGRLITLPQCDLARPPRLASLRLTCADMRKARAPEFEIP